MKLYDEKVKNLSKEKTYAMPIDANAEILRILSGINERELKLLIYLNQAILNFFMNNDSILEGMSDTFANKELFEVILAERNKVLVDAIETSEYDKVFITY
ncbi:MAG: hypothetical protein LBD88_00925 [Candidatus Peribacteria bacterium]|jgi:hypothetical protein|nr:hypothetical protein [Candidatus Peribacteria bacterium]